MTRIAAVEGGGTTWVVAISVDNPENIVDQKRFQTEDPVTTLSLIRNWLKTKEFDCLGIATFGPVDCKIGSAQYGFITSTPKPKWKNTNVLELLGVGSEIKVPFKFDTDVNAPALAEFQSRYINHSPDGSPLQSCAYITIGTGVGVGLVVNGKTVKGLLHPEAGHIQVKRHPNDSFEGSCPYHTDCIEGMCSSGALTGRKGCSISDLPSLSDDDELWNILAYYIAQLCVNLILIASPEYIAIGGGVLNRTSLYGKIQTHTLLLLNGYIENKLLSEEGIKDYVGPPKWGSCSGLVGAAFLGKTAWQEQQLNITI